ncbi:MAG TPA: glycosyltransferase family 4 protein, partial [Dehalococcoidia bacterium]|nr:glycosyltransferase family 4 protein [Dehalococcoidia bacterium]
FDIIHTHLPTPWSADLSVVLGRLRGSGVVMTYHNDIVGQGAGGTIAAAYNASLLRLSLALSHRIVVNSPSVATRRGSPLRAHRRKVAIVPNGVDTEALYPSLEQRSTARIGFMSALDDFHAYKGLPILLAAMRQVVSAYPEAQLLVGGSGSRLADYRRLAAHLGLAGSVQFLGFVPEDELRDFFNRCSLFVLPSTDRLREGFGLVALEAMACGVPVVVSRAAGMARLLEKDNLGTVVPTGDPAALAAAVNAALQNSEQAMEQGLAGRAAVETCYSWKGVVARLESLYRECLQEAR